MNHFPILNALPLLIFVKHIGNFEIKPLTHFTAAPFKKNIICANYKSSDAAMLENAKIQVTREPGNESWNVILGGKRSENWREKLQ